MYETGLQDIRQLEYFADSWVAVGSDGRMSTWGKYTSQCEGVVGIKRLMDGHGKVNIYDDGNAAVALLGDGTVIAYGHPCKSSARVPGQLRQVVRIQATCGAFAAIRSDGSVVTWGLKDSGGCSLAVQTQLQHVRDIQASRFAFAAVRDDGHVVTWGDKEHGGDSRSVQRQLRDVRCI